MQVPVRTHRPAKVAAVEKITSLAEKHSVIAASKLHKVRAAQIIELRRRFRGEMEIVVAKNKLAVIALKRTKLKGIEELTQRLDGQNALIFTDMNPFKLFLLLEKNRVDLPARAGDTATGDIVIPAGNTGQPPGPIISEFKEVGVSTRIDTGSIWVKKDTVVAKAGDKITPKLAGLLSKLGIKPIRAGVSLFTAYIDGMTLQEEDVRLDLSAYQKHLVEAHTAGLALALEASYPSPLILPMLLSRAAAHGRSLAAAAGHMTKETAPEILARAQREVSAVYAAAQQKGYT